MSKSASEWSVASKANQFMDSVFLERKPPGKPYLRKNVSTLKALRDEMFALGFDAPFKGLQEFYYALRSLKLQYPQSYHEKTREVVRGLKELKQEAYIKRVTLDRVRVALKANQMALQRLDSRVFDSGLASHAPLGGEWAVKLEKMNVHARAAFFQLFEELAGGSDSREVSIDVKFERNGAELRAVEVVPVDSKAVEYLNDKYGKGKFQVLNVRFSTQRLGLVKDKYSRFCLAISVIERIEKAAREKSVSELSGQVDLERLEVYEKILRRHNLSPEARTLDLDALDGLKGE
ncbi:MAG TPA: DUF530 family protein, partial [archaeon]|nr:DUF530 family protein [archaeon]